MKLGYAYRISEWTGFGIPGVHYKGPALDYHRPYGADIFPITPNRQYHLYLKLCLVHAEQEAELRNPDLEEKCYQSNAVTVSLQ